MAAPEEPRLAPASIAIITRGRRRFQTMASAPASDAPWPRSPSNNPERVAETGMGSAPVATDAAAVHPSTIAVPAIAPSPLALLRLTAPPPDGSVAREREVPRRCGARGGRRAHPARPRA